jgi:bifunctional DNA-binding transcriptional regulator/antitoxin component of YhaV-PrlF toxin-antitoxin module
MEEIIEDVSSFSNDRLYVPIKIQRALDLKQGDEIIWIRIDDGYIIRKKELRKIIEHYSPSENARHFQLLSSYHQRAYQGRL